MAKVTPKWRREWCLVFVLLLLLAGPAFAQAPPTPDGLKADYYDGVNFDRFVLSRRDATIAFDWGHQPPAPGVPAEFFSVRWTGWLVPPASGRYIFHVTVDDGMRIWLNDQLILNEWRPQPVRSFTAAAELKAGEPYRLRVEYFQDILDTRAQLTWERPDVPKTTPPSSWRNLWGMTASAPGPSPISTQFLFTRNPRPAPPMAVPLRQVVVTAKRPAQPQPKQPEPRPRQTSAAATVAPLRPAPALTPAAIVPASLPSKPLLVADSGSTAQLAGLAVGEAVTLPELYFNQGQALLLPPARAALDGLAAALKSRPALRFEVQGHTDNVGNAELNRQLSQERAETVCLYLTAHGVGPGQLRPVGYGGTQPVADNADPAQRPRNRRVVLRRL
ncbi:MAG: hypothetical protein JWR44_22 [Hymenobacter sp.]|jgi:outer membrane protein OmpA-like peptidoglycan-associated protein|nr:hypothetical protein [Hymenobacter sp.]